MLNIVQQMAKHIIIAWLIATISVFGNAEILVGPQDTEAEMNKTVELHCKATVSDVEWLHLPLRAPHPEIVYKEGYFYNGYKKRFNASRINDGISVLIIHNVKPSDAGKFTCLENSETPSRRTAELIVFERFPSNETCAGKYTCKPVCNELELSCEMKAHGNHIPSMQWIDSEGRKLISWQVMTNDTAISTIKLQADPYVAVSFTCRLKYLEPALTSKYSWTYSTSVAKEKESPIKPQNQPTEVPQQQPEQPVSITTVIIAVIVTFLVTALLAGILIIFIRKKKTAKRKSKKNLGRRTSVIEPETSGGVSQSLISIPKEKSEKENEEKFILCKSVNVDSPICGLAAIDDEVFIMTRGGRFVEVFDLCKGKFKRCWKINGLIEPTHMAACPVEKTILICDGKKAADENKMLCFDINGNQVSRSWLSEFKRNRIFTTNESNAIVPESWRIPVREYTGTGALQTIASGGRNELHLFPVTLNEENFVTSLGVVSDQREICILNKEGQVINFLTSDSNSSLSVPRSLAVDKKGNIYICDMNNGRINMLNPELQFKCFLDITSDGYNLMVPLSIYLHEYNNRSWLLVATVSRTINNGELEESQFGIYKRNLSSDVLRLE